MFMQFNKNSEEELDMLDVNIANIANELTDLVIDGKLMASKLEKQAGFCTNFGAHQSNPFGGANTNLVDNYKASNDFVNSKVFGNNFQEFYQNENVHVRNASNENGDFKRRASAADAEHVGLNFGDGEMFAHFKRRSSVNDANDYMDFQFGGTTAGVAASLESQIYQTAKYEKIDSRKELQNSFQALHQSNYVQITRNVNSANEAFEKQISQAFSRNSYPHHFPKTADFNRRASAADVEHVGVCFGNAQSHHPIAAHLKRRASATDVERLSKGHSTVTQPVALLNAAVSDDMTRYWHVGSEVNTTGARKKHSLLKPATEEHKNTDNIVINLAAMDLNLEGKETNDVLRLFDLMRKLHLYLNDDPFKAESFINNKYSTHFVKPQPFMPCTMNIRTHIKHIVYKCNGFTQEKSRKLDEYHCADRQKYFECSRSIYVLRKLTKQLETFKTSDFEHRKGVFVHSFAAAKAKNLELLLTQMIDKIRECNNFVEVYRLSIQKNIQETGLTSMEFLQKAVAIAAAMKPGTTETENKNINVLNVNPSEEENGAAAPHGVCNSVEKHKSNNDGEAIGGSRNAMRFVGTVI